MIWGSSGVVQGRVKSSRGQWSDPGESGSEESGMVQGRVESSRREWSGSGESEVIQGRAE